MSYNDDAQMNLQNLLIRWAQCGIDWEEDPGYNGSVSSSVFQDCKTGLLVDMPGDTLYLSNDICCNVPTPVSLANGTVSGSMTTNCGLVPVTMVVPWGSDANGQCDIPLGITNAVQVTGGTEFSLALLANGTVVGWGFDGAGGLVPANLFGVTMIASGYDHNVALLTNGTVTAWGNNLFYQTNVPAGLTIVIGISAQAEHSLALTSAGGVVAWGGGLSNVPSGLSGVSAIAAGGEHSLAVSNGFVVAWGDNSYGQCSVPAGLSNVWGVAACWGHSVALKNDGTVVAWGDNSYGETSVPAGLSNVVAVAAGGYTNPYTACSLALKSDGTVVAWGTSEVLNPVAGLSNVIAIGAGRDHALAIRNGLPTPVITVEPTNQYQVAGGNATFSAKGVGVYGVAYQWQFNGANISGATGSSLTLTGVQGAQEGAYDVVVTGNGGTGSIISSNVTFDLVTTPVITSQTPMPTNLLVAYMTNLTLTVAATAPGQSNGFPLSYQWQFSGTAIPGATSSSYTFPFSNAGPYSVTVSNAAGSASAGWQLSLTYVGSYIDIGTLAYHLSTNAIGHTNGYTATYNCMLEYTAPSSTNLNRLTNAVWSTNFWLQGVRGLTATPIGYSNVLGGQGLPTMVSPRHYLFAQHMDPEANVLAFLDTNNVIYWRTTLQHVDIPTSLTFGIESDISVGLLNADLPASVGYLPVLPASFANYLPTNDLSVFQGIGMNQDFCLFGQPMTVGDTGNLFVDWNSANTAPFGLGTNWNVAVCCGDSSAPEMLLIGNQLVLASHNVTDYTGPNYGWAFDLINQYMHYLSTNNFVSA